MSLSVKEILSLGERQLKESGVENADIDSKLLYCHLTNITRTELILEYQNILQDLLCDEYFKLIENIDDVIDPELTIQQVNLYLLSICTGFTEITFRICYKHICDLELNLIGEYKNISISHVKNIYRGIVDNSYIKSNIEKIINCIKGINGLSKFSMGKYMQIADWIEEIDLISMFEMYSYLLGEDVESVFSFILDKISDEVVYSNDINIEEVSEQVLQELEGKIRLFKKLYIDEDVSIIIRNKDHIIYKINDVLKIAQL